MPPDIRPPSQGWIRVPNNLDVSGAGTAIREALKELSLEISEVRGSFGGQKPYVTKADVEALIAKAIGSIPATSSVGSGSVVSVGLSLPTSVFDVTGSPVTSAGTLTATFDSQSANRAFYGPTSGGAATPAFRTAVSADLTGGTAGTSGQALISGGAGAATWFAATQGGVLWGSGASGVLASSAAGTSGQVLQSAGTGAPTWTTATYPSTAIGTGTILRADGTNWVATTATYPNTTTINQILYSSAANTVTGLATANSSVLVTNGTGVPSLSTDLPTAITIGGAYIYRVGGTDVSLADGGTSASLTAAAGAVVYSAASAMALSAAGTTGQALISGGTGSPTWWAPTAGSVVFAGTAGILQQNNAKLFWDNTDELFVVGSAAGVAYAKITGDFPSTRAAGASYGIYGRMVANPSGTPAGSTYFGGYFLGSSNGSNAQNFAVAAPGSIRAMEAYANHAGTGTATFLSAGVFGLENSGMGTTTAGAGVYVRNSTVSMGTFTTAYGIYVESQTAAGTNWAIFSAGGQSAHAGNLRIGSTVAPTTTLDVTGNALLSGTLTLTPMTARSVLFAGTAGLVSQDNANLNYDSAAVRLYVGGTSLGTSATTRFSVTETTTVTSGTRVASYGEQIANPSGSSSASYIGALFDIFTAAANAQNLTSAVGMRGVSGQITHQGTGTVTAAQAFLGVVRNSTGASGTITTADVYHAFAPTVAAGKAITTLRAFYAANQGATGVTNAYGLYIDNVTGASSINRAIETAGGTNLLRSALNDTDFFTLTTTATNDDPNYIVRQGRITTTDATTTTINTIAISASNTYMIEARIVARRTGGAAGTADDGAVYIIVGSFTTKTGTVTQLGTTTTVHSGEDQGAWGAQFTVSGANVLVQVTGAGSNNVTWHSTIVVQNVGT